MALALAAVLLTGPPALAQPAATDRATRPTGEARPARTHLLEQLYRSGLARMARGDPAGALRAFEVASDIAPELPQMHYACALARVLADFPHRERALPAIRRALAADPAQPLYSIVNVMADPTLSVPKADGALYFTPAGARALRAAAAALADSRAAYNGKYFAAVVRRLEPTGDAALPQRLAGFRRMIGQGGTVRLPHVAEPQSFGRLLVIGVPSAAFSPYEPRLVQRLANGLDALTAEAGRPPHGGGS